MNTSRSLSEPIASGSDQPLVSIVVPFYSTYKAYFEECIESILRQTHTNWELIIVDDASPDDIARITVEYFADSRISLIRHDRNRGQAAARNTGICASKGEYFMPVDCDDMLSPTHVEKVLHCLRSTPGSNVAYADYQLFFATTGDMQFPVRDTRALLRDQWIPHPGTIFRRSLWERAQGYSEDDVFRDGNEDWDFLLRAVEVGLSAVRVPEPSYYYRQHAHSISSSRFCFADYLTRRAMYTRHRALFDDLRMRRPFLACGYRTSANAFWRRRQRVKALLLLFQAVYLAPTDSLAAMYRKFRPLLSS